MPTACESVPADVERGVFVVLEGMPCAGKTTHLFSTGLALHELTGRVPRTTADPYGAPQHTLSAWAVREARRLPSEEPAICECGDCQECLEDSRPLYAPPLDTGMAYIANRVHLSEKIDAWLAAGHDVVCDRWAHSTLAFQGKDDPHLAAMLGAVSMDTLVVMPDLTLVLDLPFQEFTRRLSMREAATGTHRLVDRITQADYDKIRRRYYEMAHLAFDHDWVDDTYEDLERGICVINAARPAEEVFASIKNTLSKFFKATRDNVRLPCVGSIT